MANHTDEHGKSVHAKSKVAKTMRERLRKSLMSGKAKYEASLPPAKGHRIGTQGLKANIAARFRRGPHLVSSK